MTMSSHLLSTTFVGLDDGPMGQVLAPHWKMLTVACQVWFGKLWVGNVWFVLGL